MEPASLVIFFFCMPLTAALVLSFIWLGGPPVPILAQVAASAFVVGLASFLVWFVRILGRLAAAR